MRDFNFKAEYQKLLTPEVVAYLTQIHEYKGQQNLFIEAKADALSNLLEVAKIQSTEASNRIEGIITTDDRLKKIVREKTMPQTRSEKEIAGYRDNRDGRNDKLIELMNESGMSVSLEAMRDMFGDDTVLTRAHFARYMVNKGYVSSTNEAFDRYLGEGKPFYVSRQMPDPARAVELIHEAGGAAVLAHPILYKMSDSELTKLCQYLKRHGLNGIEGIYSTYRSGDETTIRRIANDCGLLISGGSDFHGANKPAISLGTGKACLWIRRSAPSSRHSQRADRPPP